MDKGGGQYRTENISINPPSLIRILTGNKINACGPNAQGTERQGKIIFYMQNLCLRAQIRTLRKENGYFYEKTNFFNCYGHYSFRAYGMWKHSIK